MPESVQGERRPIDPVRQPIINSPYDHPRWHYDVGADGIARGPAKTGRRPAEDYVAPVPGAVGQAKALIGTEDPRALMQHIADLRSLVEQWRVHGYPGATSVSRDLLFYWEDLDRERRLYFAQLDAVRTLIYLTEVAPADVLKRLKSINAEYNDGMRRVAVKMATGVGKTVVMAMTALWQSANHWENPDDERFTNRFVAIAPGITVRDRLLSGLRADSVDQSDVYSEMDLLPLVGEYRKRINSAQIEVVNFQQFIQKKIDAGASGNGKIVSGYKDKYETEVEALSRVLGDLFALGHERVMAFNDEGHHCYRDGGKSAEGRESAIWYGGLKSLRDRGKLHSVVDFSATPMFISGDRNRKNRLFPWVVSDYPVVDAIEAGIVKIPSAPVSDNRSQDSMPLFRDIYNLTKDGKSGFMSANRGRANWINEDLAAALRTMYADYAEESRRWERIRTDSKVPAVVIVANSVVNADGLFKYIAGYENEDGVPVDGRVGSLLSNIENGAYLDAPRTIFMHSKMEASEGDQAGGVSKPIRGLADIYRQRYPHARLSEDRRDHRKLAEGSHYEVMRRVLNTVGKPGEPGERVRCVVSVGMITEGWDAGTVTHMIGFRAFGSQLLCEQVGGRTLRRRVYEVGEDGKFAPEYSTIFGVPWDHVRSTENGREERDAPDPSSVYSVRLVSGREAHRVCWPNVVGYDAYGGEDQISIGVEDWDGVEKLSLNSDDVRRTRLASIPGRSVDASADLVSFRRLAFHAAGDFVSRQKALHAAGSSINARLFRQALNVLERGRELGVIEADDGRSYDLSIGTGRYLSDWLMRISAVGESVSARGIEAKLDDDGSPFRFYIPFQGYETSREHVYETLKSEISHAVCDSGWEVRAAQTLDLRDDVIGWVRNERLNWHIPWLDESGGTAIWRRYMPDFVARVSCDGDERDLILVIEIKGLEREDAPEKRRYAEDFWLPSVNAHSEFSELGRWDYLYVTHPDDLDGKINDAKSRLASSF